MILLDTDDGFVVYGPFDSGMEAAVFWLDVASLLDFTNVRQAHVCDLASPSHDSSPVSSIGGPDSTDGRVRGWVVRLVTAVDEPELVGPFDDAPAAHAWQARRADAGMVAPILAP